MKEEKNNICKHEDCNFEAHNGHDCCVLHVNYKKIFSEIIKIPNSSSINFKGHLVSYIVDYIFKNKLENHEISQKEYEDYYINSKSLSSVITGKIKKPIKFIEIGFPERLDSDQDDYQYILRKLESVEFIDCDFDCSSLKSINVSCSFQDCRFSNNYEIINHSAIDNNKPLFNLCTFNMTSTVQTPKSIPFHVLLFKDCNFKSKLEFKNTTFDLPVFDLSKNKIEMSSLYIKDCTFEDKFILDKKETPQIELKKIGTIDISNSIFESDFQIKNNSIGILNAYNTHFLNIVDFFKTKFYKLVLLKCTVEDVIGFEECEFGNLKNYDFQNKSHFTYTLFKSFANFRNTEFFYGLDIENTNFKETPNFLNTSIEKNIANKNTNRETFRIIKNSFDKVGNHIEANKFFVFEMKRYRQELKESGTWAEKQVYKWNDRISSFGLSYLKPLGWLILSMILFGILIYGKNKNLIYFFTEKTNENISSVIETINKFAELFLPFKKFLVSGMELISLLFYIVFLILSWQIIVAVKRHTKR